MTDFFTNLFHRHMGTGNLVAPRGQSRFESELAGGVTPPMDQSEDEESSLNDQYRMESATQNPTTPPTKPMDESPVDRPEPLSIGTDMLVTVNHDEGVNPEGKGVQHHKKVDLPPARDMMTAYAHAPPQAVDRGRPASRHQDPPPMEPNPLKPQLTLPQNPWQPEVHNPTTTETQHRPHRSGVLTERSSEAADKLALQPDDHLWEDTLDNRIRTMIARLRGRPKRQPAGPAESQLPGRPMADEPNHAVTTEKDQDPLQLQVAPMPDASESAGASHPDRTQQDAAPPSHRPVDDGLLAPPPWLTELQAGFHRRWHAKHPKTESDPVVNVTIGRIEVRAVPAEAPPKTRRKKRPSKVMSLDAYLNKREERS